MNHHHYHQETTPIQAIKRTDQDRHHHPIIKDHRRLHHHQCYQIIQLLWNRIMADGPKVLWTTILDRKALSLETQTTWL